MKMQWENKLSEIQAKNAHSINNEKELALKVAQVVWILASEK